MDTMPSTLENWKTFSSSILQIPAMKRLHHETHMIGLANRRLWDEGSSKTKCIMDIRDIEGKVPAIA